VIKEIGYSVGQPISVLYSIVASIFFAIAIVIYMYVYSTIKK
jgi:tetrahydromethanopterin S-methyltransferase subunit G